MGLDGVELIMAVEEEFGIAISDSEAEQIRTPRQLYETIGRKLHTTPSDTCLTQRAFYSVRRALMLVHPLRRRQITPATRLESIIPRHNRRKHWTTLRERVGSVAWPRLGVPRVVSIPATCVTIAVAAALWWRLFRPPLLGQEWPLTPLFALIAISLVTEAITLRSVSTLQTDFATPTVGSLAEYLVSYSPYLVAPRSPEWTNELVRARTRKIIVEQLAIAPDFDDDAEFVRDLGVD